MCVAFKWIFVYFDVMHARVFKTDKITFTGGHFNLLIMKNRMYLIFCLCSMQIQQTNGTMNDIRMKNVRMKKKSIIKKANECKMTHRHYHQRCFDASPIMKESFTTHTHRASTSKKATPKENKSSTNSLTKSNCLINKFVFVCVCVLMHC